MAIMYYVRLALNTISPIFLITSPITSYADQIYSIHRQRSSDGFAMDIPLIMLVASITKIFFWFGDPYDMTLLVQAVVMIVVQILLLHVALTNRALSNPAHDLHTPFAQSDHLSKRPYDFWQWRSSRPYWIFLAYFTGALCVLQFMIGDVASYISFIGYFALAVEAMLPVPQILQNHQQRSCKGFRLSVIANWLIGDIFKLSFFFLGGNDIPWAFKLCGLFQWLCDMYLGVQFVQFGDGQHELERVRAWVSQKASGL